MDIYMILQLLANLCVIAEFVRPLVWTLLPCKISVTFQVSSETKSTISVTAPTVPWMIARSPELLI